MCVCNVDALVHACASCTCVHVCVYMGVCVCVCVCIQHSDLPNDSLSVSKDEVEDQTEHSKGYSGRHKDKVCNRHTFMDFFCNIVNDSNTIGRNAI